MTGVTETLDWTELDYGSVGYAQAAPCVDKPVPVPPSVRGSMQEEGRCSGGSMGRGSSDSSGGGG